MHGYIGLPECIHFDDLTNHTQNVQDHRSMQTLPVVSPNPSQRRICTHHRILVHASWTLSVHSAFDVFLYLLPLFAYKLSLVRMWACFFWGLILSPVCGLATDCKPPCFVGRVYQRSCVFSVTCCACFSHGCMNGVNMAGALVGWWCVSDRHPPLPQQLAKV